MSPPVLAAETLSVALGARSYDIVVGEGLIERLADHLKDALARPVTALVTDETVAEHHLPRALKGLRAAGIACEPVIVPAGEAAKSFDALERLCGCLIDLGIERRDTILALGGGAVGDLTGFAAAILRRGVSFVQIPTTLLAQVDSAVGGKTGINMPQGKNLVGAFHQPRKVIADLTTLDTLPERQLKAGYAEVVKYGLIDRPDFFAWLERDGHRLLAGDRAATLEAVVTACRAKAAIVAADEREAGTRALLNLGHTFGHALEAACGYDGSLLHGEAVAIGLALAFELSARLGLAPAADAARVREHLERCGLPVSPKAVRRPLSADHLVALMGQDKKVEGGRLAFVLARGIGSAFLTRDVPQDALYALLQDALA